MTKEEIKNKRNYLLTKLNRMWGKIDETDKMILSLIPKIKEEIEKYPNEDIYVDDNGKMANLNYVLEIRKGNNHYNICNLSCYIKEISNKIIELYPYSKEEIEEIERKRIKELIKKEKRREQNIKREKERLKNGIFNSDDRVGFGKYKMFKWKNLPNKDENYIKWLIGQNEDGNFKTFLNELIDKKETKK